MTLRIWNKETKNTKIPSDLPDPAGSFVGMEIDVKSLICAVSDI